MGFRYLASDETHEDYDSPTGDNPTLTLPDVLDQRSVSSFNTPAETLADSMLWCVSRLRGKYHPTNNVWERCPMGQPLQNTNSRWEFVLSGGIGAWRQCDVTDAGSLVFAVPRLVRSVNISDFVVWVNGALGGGAHGAGLPATLPTAKLYLSSVGTGATLVGTLTDPSTNLTEYESVHRLTNGTPHVPPTSVLHDRDRLYIEITGETDAGVAAPDLLGLLSAYVYVAPQDGALGDEDPP